MNAKNDKKPTTEPETNIIPHHVSLQNRPHKAAKIPGAGNSRDRIVELAEISNICFWETDAQLRLVYCSPAVEGMFGVPPAEIIGHSILEIAASSEREKIGQVIRESLSRLEAFRKIRVHVQYLNGDTRIHQVSGFPMVDANGLLVGLRGVSEDVTQEAKEAEALKTEKEMAEKKSAQSSEFITMLSHDLRGPLGGILGVLGLLDDTNLAPAQKEYVGLLQHASYDLTILVENILDHARSEAGRLIVKPSRFFWKQTFTDLGKLLHSKMQMKHIRLTSDFDPSVPEQLVTDSTLFRRIFSNLINNAVTYTYAEDSVIISAKPTATQMIEFSVIDHGPGIPKEALSTIFEPFKSLSSTIQRGSGFGLGLAIVARLTNALGGTVRVESDEGKGATFRVQLPI